MFMDISSGMVQSLLPLFLVSSLGVSALGVGLIDGLAHAVALGLKVFSGVISDYTGKRKLLAVFGYALGAFSKPFFAVSGSALEILSARILDRVGKGLRSAPRDALVADIAPATMRGAAYGLRQAIDAFGAFIGPLIAIALMFLWANDYRAVFWCATIPGVLAVLLLVVGVKEPKSQKKSVRTNPLTKKNIKRLGAPFYTVILVSSLFALSRFSEAFLVLRAVETGVSPALVPLVMVIMNLMYAMASYPFGSLSDRFSGSMLLAFGLTILALAHSILASADVWFVFMVGVMLWGVHMGVTQGLLAKMVADSAPEDIRGTAFGFFNFSQGIAFLIANILAGYMWDQHGSAVTFYIGICFSLIACTTVIGMAYRSKM
ncbi:MFS transporter [Kordiimonas pumila]|uniref:MFS transporter n=1 Tax=Kordiimonas pumila TaxID=2161677 RepID=A0ABV7D663_9PROT|nr:MFS transporter [Kordiimonas pumila]